MARVFVQILFGLSNEKPKLPCWFSSEPGLPSSASSGERSASRDMSGEGPGSSLLRLDFPLPLRLKRRAS